MIFTFSKNTSKAFHSSILNEILLKTEKLHHITHIQTENSKSLTKLFTHSLKLFKAQFFKRLIHFISQAKGNIKLTNYDFPSGKFDISIYCLP
jgi:hypothetical protein